MLFIVHDNLTSCWMVCIDWDFFPGGLPYLWLPLIGYSGYSDRFILSEKGKCLRRSDGRPKHRSFRETCVPTLPGQLPCFHLFYLGSRLVYLLARTWESHKGIKEMLRAPPVCGPTMPVASLDTEESKQTPSAQLCLRMNCESPTFSNDFDIFDDI